MSKVIEFLKNEWNSYSKRMQISLYVLFALLVFAAIFAVQILGWGLGYTDMDNNFAMGLWIIGDLGLVALGGGAFLTGFLLYIFRVDKLQPFINSTVLIGFMCYLFTFVLLVFDIGQPLRAWFGYAYPNWGPYLMPTSMLTEVVWCLTFYFIVLCIELIPITLSHKFFAKIPALRHTAHYMHKLMWIFAAVGTFLSFFHQGSLGGGMWGELYAKPIWFRPHYFYLAIVAAMAAGPCLMMLIPKIASWITNKELIPKESYMTLAKVAGITFIAFFIFRVYDFYTLYTFYVPLYDRNLVDLMGGYYGWWTMIAELLTAVVAIVILNVKTLRENEPYFIAGLFCGVMSITVQKIAAVLHGFSVPNFPWKDFTTYNPTIQEWGIFFGSIACMILIYMWFVKYIPMFPEKKHGDDAH